MKALALPLLLLLPIAFSSSCTKKYQNPDPVVSKWQEVKLRLYATKNDTFMYDTTYFHPFTTNDYIQFNGNGTCVIVNDYDYFPNLPGEPKTPQPVTSSGAPFLFNCNWQNVGVGYVITPPPENGPPTPGPPPPLDTAFLSLSDTLRLQSIGQLGLPVYKVVSEAYYVKE